MENPGKTIRGFARNFLIDLPIKLKPYVDYQPGF